MKNAAPAAVCLIAVLLFLLLPLRLCLSEEGKKAEPLLKEAVVFFEQGETDKTLQIAKGVVAADPNNAMAYDLLGYVFLRKTRFDDSLHAFDSALKIKPSLRTSRTGKGLALFNRGDYREAEAVLTEALSLNPYPSSTYYALGLLYEKLGNYEKAVSQFKEGLRTFKSGKK